MSWCIWVDPDTPGVRRRLRTGLAAEVARGGAVVDGAKVTLHDIRAYRTAASFLQGALRRGAVRRTRGLMPLPPAELSSVREVVEISAELDSSGDASAEAVVAGRARLADPWVLGEAVPDGLDTEVERILRSARRFREAPASTAAAVRKAVHDATGETLPRGPRVLGARIGDGPILVPGALSPAPGTAYVVPNADLVDALPETFRGRIAAGDPAEVRGRVAAALALGVAADHVLDPPGDGDPRSRVLAAAYIRRAAAVGTWDPPRPPRPPRECTHDGCTQPPTFATEPTAVPRWCGEHAPAGSPTTAAVGGRVLAPVMEDFRGRCVTALDFRAMYPSLMIAHNLSPETVADGERGRIMSYTCDTAGGEPREYCRAVRDVPGALPQLLRELRALREGEADRDGPVAREFKLLANAVYGLCGTWWSPLGGRAGGEVQRLVVQAGRDLLARTIAAAEARGMRVVYGDTDSCFVLADPEAAGALAAEVSGREPPPVTLAVERVFRTWVPVSRKRYYGETMDGEFIEKGVATVRSDLPEPAREPLRAAMRAVLAGEDPVAVYAAAASRLVETGDAAAARLGRQALSQLLAAFALPAAAPGPSPETAVPSRPQTEMEITLRAAAYSRRAALWNVHVTFAAGGGMVQGEFEREAQPVDRRDGGQAAVCAAAVREAALRVRDAGFEVSGTVVGVEGKDAVAGGVLRLAREPPVELARVLAPAGELRVA